VLQDSYSSTHPQSLQQECHSLILCCINRRRLPRVNVGVRTCSCLHCIRPPSRQQVPVCHAGCISCACMHLLKAWINPLRGGVHAGTATHPCQSAVAAGVLQSLPSSVCLQHASCRASMLCAAAQACRQRTAGMGLCGCSSLSKSIRPSRSPAARGVSRAGHTTQVSNPHARHKPLQSHKLNEPFSKCMHAHETAQCTGIRPSTRHSATDPCC
jgi:hypothetical protein